MEKVETFDADCESLFLGGFLELDAEVVGGGVARFFDDADGFGHFFVVAGGDLAGEEVRLKDALAVVAPFAEPNVFIFKYLVWGKK